MTIRPSRRNEHWVMETMAGKPFVAEGQQPARANGDRGVDGVNSVAESGEKAV